MKPLILSFTLAAVALSFSAPVMAADQSQDVFNIEDMSGNTVEKRKKKRVKGGSGCDDAGDVIEHPECR